MPNTPLTADEKTELINLHQKAASVKAKAGKTADAQYHEDRVKALTPEKHGDQEYTETERTMRIYRIVRVYRNDRPSRTTRTGLTLQEAQRHCARKDTSTAAYMDTYTTMRGVSVK